MVDSEHTWSKNEPFSWHLENNILNQGKPIARIWDLKGKTFYTASKH